MTHMPEAQPDYIGKITVEDRLGLDARLRGTSAFDELTGKLTQRAQKESEFVPALQRIVDATRVSPKDFARELRFGSSDTPHTVSERLVGRWVSLAAEKALLETKGSLNESEGARYLALDGDVARLEDAMLLAHKGKKQVMLNEGALNVLLDPSGDRLDSLVRTIHDQEIVLKLKFMTTALLGGYVLTACGFGGGTIPTPGPDVSPIRTPIVQTVPGLTDTVEPQPTQVGNYELGGGGPITAEKLAQMKAEDATLEAQLTWLDQWGDWYASADPAIRPFTAEEARNDRIFYKWVDNDGNTHWKVAWKFPNYPGHANTITTPPPPTWKDLNPPVAANTGHEIAPGEGPLFISTEVVAGSDLAGMGVPVGAQLAAEHGTGAWVMVSADAVVARVNQEGFWERVFDVPDFYRGLAPTLEQFTLVDKSDIPDIIAFLRSKPSLLTSDEPIKFGEIVTSSSGSSFVEFVAPGGSWAVAGSIKIEDGGIIPHILIYEVRMQDGSRGYFAGYFYDPVEKYAVLRYNDLLNQPLNSPYNLTIALQFSETEAELFPYGVRLLNQPEYHQSVATWKDTGIIPFEIENMILYIIP